MKLWLCYRCELPKGHPFQAALPVCPKCGTDGRHPRTARFVVERKAVHYDPVDPSFPAPEGADPIHKNVQACDGKPTGTKGGTATGVPSCVTCPACLETAEWKAAAEAAGVPVVPPEQDFEVQIRTQPL